MKDRVLRGQLYLADDPELRVELARAQALLERYNHTTHVDLHERDRLLRELLGAVGEGVVVKPTLRCDYGTPITIGAGTFVNYDCVFLDVAPITIGAYCQFATRVQLVTATHPIDPEPRRIGWEYGQPITVADNVWLGAGVIVCPGVTIGQDTVVGAGAVVTRVTYPAESSRWELRRGWSVRSAITTGSNCLNGESGARTSRRGAANKACARDNNQ